MKAKDGIILLHAFSSTENESSKPIHLRSDKLKARLEVEMMTRSTNGRVAIVWKNRRGEKVDQFLLKTVNGMVSLRETLPRKEKPTFFVIGLPPKVKLGVMDLALVSAGCFELPTIIIKQAPVTDRPRIFVAAIKVFF